MRGRADRGLEPRDEALPRRSEALDGDAGDEQIRALRRCARNRRKLCSRPVAGGKRQCAAARATTCGTEIRGGAAREHAPEVRRVGAPAERYSFPRFVPSESAATVLAPSCRRKRAAAAA